MATGIQTAPPGGLSWASFKALCAESGQWLWGTVQGAFNEKASFSQIMVDAVIGMIPLVGDATAVRDLIAVTIGLVDDPKKRDNTWEWVLLVIMLFALIPIWGGAIKGVGRLTVKVGREVHGLSGAARTAKLQEAAADIVAFLNRIGSKNAEQWLKALRLSDYQAQLLKHFNELLDTMAGVLVGIRRKAGGMMPGALGQRIDGLRSGLIGLKDKGDQMIPAAIKELDQTLREIQALVRSGGETTSRRTLHEVASGKRVITRADEARLMEHGPMPARSMRGGFKQNQANAKKPGSYAEVYTHEKGYPDLAKWPDPETDEITAIMAFSGRIFNRPLNEGEQIYRLFGPGGTTHGTKIRESVPGGGWWGLGPPPSSAKEWREKAAVLDEFNRDGFIVVGTLPAGKEVKAAVGTVAEQSGTKIPGQYLPGGTTQAVIDFPANAKAELQRLGEQVMHSNKPQSWTDPASGIRFEIRPTGWSDANGIHGYFHAPGQYTSGTATLKSGEVASKKERQPL